MWCMSKSKNEMKRVRVSIEINLDTHTYTWRRKETHVLCTRLFTFIHGYGCVCVRFFIIRLLSFHIIDLYHRMPIVIRFIFVIMSQGTKNGGTALKWDWDVAFCIRYLGTYPPPPPPHSNSQSFYFSLFFPFPNLILCLRKASRYFSRSHTSHLI